MIETVKQPAFKREDFSRRGKKPGLTGMMLLKNEAAFAEASFESIRPYFDEILIVYNDCTDGTDEIVAELAARYPKLVRAYHYVPKIVPLGTAEHRRTPAGSMHSIVYYFNFILSKAHYQVRCMWAGDQIAIPETFGAIIERIRSVRRGTWDWLLSPWGIGYWWYEGVNLWSHEGQVYVPSTRPTIGSRHDHAFYPAGRLLVYKRWSRSEYLFTRVLVHRYIGYMFYHLKGMKPDRGTSKYKLDEAPESLYKSYVQKRWTMPGLWTVDEFKAREPAVRNLPDPASLGIRAENS